MSALDAFQVATLPNSQAVLAIRTGLPAKAFEEVAEVFGLTSEGLAQRLGISIRTIRDQRKRHVRLSSGNTEKLVRAARIYELARSIFSTPVAVSQWLASPAPALEGQCPLTLLDTDIGSREVESVLQGIAYGNVM